MRVLGAEVFLEQVVRLLKQEFRFFPFACFHKNCAEANLAHGDGWMQGAKIFQIRFQRRFEQVPRFFVLTQISVNVRQVGLANGDAWIPRLMQFL